MPKSFWVELTLCWHQYCVTCINPHTRYVQSVCCCVHHSVKYTNTQTITAVTLYLLIPTMGKADPTRQLDASVIVRAQSLSVKISMRYIKTSKGINISPFFLLCLVQTKLTFDEYCECNVECKQIFVACNIYCLLMVLYYYMHVEYNIWHVLVSMHVQYLSCLPVYGIIYSLHVMCANIIVFFLFFYMSGWQHWYQDKVYCLVKGSASLLTECTIIDKKHIHNWGISKMQCYTS